MVNMSVERDGIVAIDGIMLNGKSSLELGVLRLNGLRRKGRMANNGEIGKTVQKRRFHKTRTRE